MDTAFFALCDAAASAMLAACAVYRARQYGHHFTGAMLLGCLAGMVSPVVRDVLLGLPAALALESAALPAALLGGLCGMAGARWNARNWPLFRWSDTWSLAAAASLGGAKALLCGGGPVLTVLVGVAAGTAGGLARDVALGDTATAIEQKFYVTAAVLGLIIQIFLWHVYPAREFALQVLLVCPCACIALIRLGALRWQDRT